MTILSIGRCCARFDTDEGGFKSSNPTADSSFARVGVRLFFWIAVGIFQHKEKDVVVDTIVGFDVVGRPLVCSKAAVAATIPQSLVGARTSHIIGILHSCASGDE
jgi:hypothetical protein